MSAAAGGTAAAHCCVGRLAALLLPEGRPVVCLQSDMPADLNTTLPTRGRTAAGQQRPAGPCWTHTNPAAGMQCLCGVHIRAAAPACMHDNSRYSQQSFGKLWCGCDRLHAALSADACPDEQGTMVQHTSTCQTLLMLHVAVMQLMASPAISVAGCGMRCASGSYLSINDLILSKRVMSCTPADVATLLADRQQQARQVAYCKQLPQHRDRLAMTYSVASWVLLQSPYMGN